jgi:transposase
MVLNRLCDPDSKLGVLRWLQTVALPDVEIKTINHQQLLRSMDALMDNQDAVDSVVANLLRPLVDRDLSLAFYDMTTIRAEGLSSLEGDVRKFGMAKEGLITRQFMLGVVQTAEGLPIYHEVFNGNTAEAKTLLPILKKVMQRFPDLRRLILVADRGLLSLDNLDELRKLTLPSGQPLEFILAVPGRRYNEFVEMLGPLQHKCVHAGAEITDEVAWNGLRLVVAHDPVAALEQQQKRKSKMDELQSQANAWVGKLDEQDLGAKKRGRKLSDSGAKARFYHEVRESHLGNIIKVDLKGELFSYTIDEAALKLAQMMDGKLLVVTNVKDIEPQNIIERYKSLADIERGFKVLKSELEIGPVYHRLPERIRAHASICFMALILHRVMRMRLRASNAGLTPERALQALKRIQHHRVSINGAQPLAGVSSITDEDSKVFKALKVKLPSQTQQMSLL